MPFRLFYAVTQHRVLRFCVKRVFQIFASGRCPSKTTTDLGTFTELLLWKFVSMVVKTNPN